jgi:hypothetical protein
MEEGEGIKDFNAHFLSRLDSARRKLPTAMLFA